MKRYDSYKDSGVEWIGEVPSHWDTIPLKYSSQGGKKSFIDGDWIESNVITTDGIRYLTTGNVGVINYKEQGTGFISEKTFHDLNCTEVFPGDILISRLNLPIGRACIVPDLGYRIVVAVDNVIYRPNKTFLNKYYAIYQMNCKPYSENASFIARGSTMQRISRSMLGSIHLLLPPIGEQEKIASYLNSKCGEIDKVISTQENRIALLLELKQSIITHAVTKGLNPNVKMKDSGIEWIGEVPEHWEVYKTSLAFNKIGSGTTPKSSEKSYYDDDGYYWLQTGDLNDGNIIDTSKKITKKAVVECKMKFYPKGSIVIAMYGATIGKLGLLHINTSTNQACCVLCPSKKIYNTFAFYIYKSAKQEMLIDAMGGGQPNISQDIIRLLRIPVPPLAEQQEIASYLDKRCASIDASISKAQREIELLQEYKQSLITEVVTGKRKVC